MNNLLTPPPEHDLRSSTRDRQRDELLAIVAHESHEGTPRRRLVPLAAAAAVVALTAGLAVGVPALRGEDQNQPPVAGSGSVGQPEIELLGSADQARLGTACHLKTQIRKKGQPVQADPFKVIEAFRFKGTQSNTHIAHWVVIHSHLRQWESCGFNSKGEVVLVTGAGPDQVIYRPATDNMIGTGLYDKSIARLTISVDKKPPVEALLRHGFYYAPVPFVPLNPRTGRPALPFVLHGYDAAGKLVYTSPTDAERRRKNTCHVGPDGKLTSWMSNNPKPDLTTCARSYVWNYVP